MKEQVEKIKAIYKEEEEFKGFLIATNKQLIKIGIDNETQCSEDFGALVLQENMEDFIDAEILDISVVDENNTATSISSIKAIYKEEGFVEDFVDKEDFEQRMKREINHCFYAYFVNIETNIGQLQFAVYNIHNGYYGHRIFIKSKQIEKKATI